MGNTEILLIDESESDYQNLKQQLSQVPTFKFNISWVESFEEGKNAVNRPEYDVILIDHNLSSGKGIDLLKLARKQNNDRPIILISKQGSREDNLDAIKIGADDYLLKSDLSKDTLERSIRYSYERNQAKKSIRHKEERYRNLFERSIDAIGIVDTAFNIVEANQSMATLFQMPLEQISDSPLRNLFLEATDFDTLSQLIEQRGLVKKEQVVLKSSNNQKLICSLTSIALFNLENEITGFQIIIKDLTVEKRSEKRFLRAEKLGMTGRIARSIAHEVRNPLTNINLALDHLKESFSASEESDIYMGIISRNSTRINNLITELLNSSKPTTLKIEENSLKDLLEETVKLANDRIQLNDVKLSTDFKTDIMHSFDFGQLKTALLNIIINAIEAMEVGKGELSISLINNLKEVQIEIKDNGKGIDDETLSRLFDPFFTGKQSGMGLGLTSTQNIIQQHHGNIDVESEIGEGTTFLISLTKN